MTLTNENAFSGYKWIKQHNPSNPIQYIRLLSNRTYNGNFELQIIFTKESVEELGLKIGERYTIGINEEKQSMIIQETHFGGVLLTNTSRADLRAQRARIRVVLKIGESIHRQEVEKEQIYQIDKHAFRMPFSFRFKRDTAITEPHP